MKILTIALAFMTLFFAFPSQAAHEEHGHNHEGEVVEPSATAGNIENAPCEDTINIKVNGLVCDFCARSLEKIFLKRDDVAGIKVDLGKGLVAVAMKPGLTIDDTTLTKLITDSGYNVAAIDRGCEHG